MTTEIKFHNKTEIKAQAQIFAGETLTGTFLVGPGDICKMPVEGGNYNIFLRNGVTGRELTRKLDSDAKSLTLLKERNGWFVISEG